MLRYGPIGPVTAVQILAERYAHGETGEYVAQALHAGAGGFLGKDVSADDLLAGSRTVASGDALLSSRATGAAALANSGPARGPAWRALLEAQWRARLEEVTELSLAYHDAAAVTTPAPAGQPLEQQQRQLLRRAVAARRALADTDDALARLASGRYGLCEDCAAAIPAWLLVVAPEARYCPRCRPPALTPRPPRPGTQAHQLHRGRPRLSPASSPSHRRPLIVGTHIQRAMMKLHARDRAQLVVIAYQTGLIRPSQR
jgi:RNA polymerase-binding transcription factor DksA